MYKLTEELHQIQLERPLDFDWEMLNDAKDRLTEMPKLKAKLAECGLGTMEIDEFISNYRFA